MLELSFDIISFYYKKGSYRNYQKYSIKRSFDKNLKLNDIIINLWNEYKLDNGNIENQYIPHIEELLWEKYFSKQLCWDIDIEYSVYINTKIEDLEKQFNISDITIPLCLNMDGIGKSVGNKEGVKLYFHHNESDRHNKPHIHCWYSGIETRIEIKTLKVLNKPFKKSKMDIAIEFIREHQEELLNYWNKAVVNGETIPFKVEL